MTFVIHGNLPQMNQQSNQWDEHLVLFSPLNQEPHEIIATSSVSFQTTKKHQTLREEKQRSEYQG